MRTKTAADAAADAARDAAYAAYAAALAAAAAAASDLGWIQCTQCGWGREVHRSEIEAGDYLDRQACPECCIGPCKIDWTYPDGRGWVAVRDAAAR